MITGRMYQLAAMVLAALLLAALMGNGYQYVQNASLKVKVSECDQKVSALTAATQVQSAAVDALKSHSDEAFKRFDEAVVRAGKLDAKLAPVVAFVKTAKGSTCKDAMPIVDAALKGGVR